MLGKNNTDLNTTHTNYRNGNPVTLPKNFGVAITLPKTFGNVSPTSGTETNPVVEPKSFGNTIQAGN